MLPEAKPLGIDADASQEQLDARDEVAKGLIRNGRLKEKKEGLESLFTVIKAV